MIGKRRLLVISGIIVLLSNMIVVVSTGDIAIGDCSSTSISPCTSSIDDWDIIAEDIPVEWDHTNVDDSLRESIYSLVVGDWVWTNPFTLEDVLFDEIELRRLVRDDIGEYHDAILILPMMFADANAVFHWEDYYTGEQLNNPEDMFVYPYVEAGFDVYCLSTRDHNVPVEFLYDPASWSLMMQWGAEEYLSDIHEAVELIKIISGFDRIYLNTQEIGTALGMMYAVEHEENLKGIVAISGGTGGRLDKPPLLPTGLPPEVPIEDLNAVYEYLTPDPTLGSGSALLPFVHQYYAEALIDPYSEDVIHTPFGDMNWFEFYGFFTNYLGTGDEIWYYQFLDVLGVPHPASSKKEAMSFFLTIFLQDTILDPEISLEVEDWLGHINTAHGWYPWRVLVDIQHMNAVENSEYLELDWDEHFDEIDIPILIFVDTLAVNWWDQADYGDGTRNPDNTVYIMEYQGIPDLFLGARYRELIIQPSLQWIFDRQSAQHVCVGEIYIDGETIEVVIFLHEDYIDVFMIYEREYITFEVTYYNDRHRNKITWEAVDEVYGAVYGGINVKGKVAFGGQELVYSGVETNNPE